MTLVRVEIPKIIPLEHKAVIALAKWLCGYEEKFNDGKPWSQMDSVGKNSWIMFAATTMNEVVTPALLEEQ